MTWGGWQPTVLRCSACGAECKRRWWSQVLDLVLWIVFLTVLNLGPMSFGLSLVVLFALCIPWTIASGRLYHQIWAWKHPTRCGGGGEPEPEVSKA